MEKEYTYTLITKHQQYIKWYTKQNKTKNLFYTTKITNNRSVGGLIKNVYKWKNRVMYKLNKKYIYWIKSCERDKCSCSPASRGCSFYTVHHTDSKREYTDKYCVTYIHNNVIKLVHFMNEYTLWFTLSNSLKLIIGVVHMNDNFLSIWILKGMNESYK